MVRLGGARLGQRPGPLELALLAADRGEPTEERELDWITDVVDGGRLALADGARLASAVVVAALARSAVPQWSLGRKLGPPTPPEPAPAAGSHRRVPPLFVARVRLLAADGHVDAAIEAVDEIDRASRSSRGSHAARETTGAARSPTAEDRSPARSSLSRWAA